MFGGAVAVVVAPGGMGAGRVVITWTKAWDSANWVWVSANSATSS